MLRIRWNNVDTTLYQRCATLFRRCFNVGRWRCINVVQRWKSDVGFCFIFIVESTLFQRWSTTLKQHWSNVEMLAGIYLQTHKAHNYKIWHDGELWKEALHKKWYEPFITWSYVNTWQIKEQYISTLKRLIVTILDRLAAYDNGLLHKKLHDLWSCGHFKSSDKWKLISLHIHDTHGNQTWQGGGLWHGVSTRNVAWSFDTVNTISDWQSFST